MPTYAYICSCGKEFEIEQKITDSPLKTCPFGENGSCKFSKSKPQKVNRLIVSGNFILMGGGWHKDGYSKPYCKEENSQQKQSNHSEGCSEKSCACES